MTRNKVIVFKKVNPKENFPALEKKILDFWEKNKIFEKSIESRPKNKQFTFYDGPPFATGLPHYGHILAGVLKDVIPRYQTMKGFRVERRFGWDCHGLPVEYEMEKELDISGKKDIEKMGVARFNESCRKIVLRYVQEWKKMTKRIGRWVDMEHDYKTMDPWYMESIWWVFSELYKKGLIYEGYKVLPFCPRCSTPLSNFETSQGYQETTDPSIYVKFPLKTQKDTYYLVWTTTPWTLPGNSALAFNPKVKYVKVEHRGEFLILAKERLKVLDGKYKIVEEFLGKDLLNISQNIFYKPLYDTSKLAIPGEKTYNVIFANFVSTEDGTGIVHIAPAFGEDDYNFGRLKEGMAVLHTVDETGSIIKGYKIPGEEKFVKKADSEIISDLKKRGLLYKSETITHSYPFCWRCETPLIYRATSTWFVKVMAIKNKMLKTNENIHWVPAHLKHGRFKKGIESAPDWAISRNRYWGNPIPVWKCKCGEIKVISSIAELEKLSGQKISDLHKHFVDKITFPCARCGQKMKRIPEILDCWFESGSMPYAQKHYMGKPLPDFDPQKKLNFPAQYIAEGLDQTRGWFYTLHVLSNALFSSESFRNVIVNGIVLAHDGRKMSKRLKNYPDPAYLVNTYGADAMRFYLLSSPAVKAQDLRFSEKGVDQVVKTLILTLWNSYSFLITYALTERWDPQRSEKIEVKERPVLDRWIISRLNTLISDYTHRLDHYDLFKAAQLLIQFLDELSNWYIRRSRKRFWKNEDIKDKESAFETLYKVLLVYAKLLAPIMPFITEEIYQNLAQSPELRTQSYSSVHLCDWPKADKKLIDKKLEEEINLARKIIESALGFRAEAGIRLRQPLLSLSYGGRKLDYEIEEIIKEETNVEKIIFNNNLRKPNLNTKITPTLKEKGMARDLVRYIQSLRKRASLNVSDKIICYFDAPDLKIQRAIINYMEEIKKETGSVDLISQKKKVGQSEEVEIGGSKIWIGISKV